MTNYTVRVELHEADDDDYDILHEAMEKRGFVRWIKGDKASKKQLPAGEYNLVSSELKKEAVLAKAEAAANSVKSDPAPWILVTGTAGGRTWSGLKDWED